MARPDFSPDGGNLKKTVKIVVRSDAADEIVRMLAGSGYKIECASTDEEAVEKIERKKPELIILVSKSVESGIRLIRRIRSTDARSGVILVAAADVESAIEAMQSGADDLLIPPVDPKKLKNAVQRLLQSGAGREWEALTVLSHELQAPLKSVQQNLIVILEGLAGPVPEKALSMLRRVNVRIQKLQRWIGDWLTLARFESDGWICRTEDLDLRTVLEDASEQFQQQMEEKSICLTIEVPEGTSGIRGDPVLLRMLFANLIGNAVKYNRRGGTVTVRVSREKKVTRVAVCDTGNGIPADQLPHVFDRFYRIPENEKTEGSGLGLAIVQKIAEEHSGSIVAESIPGKGSTFTVILP